MKKYLLFICIFLSVFSSKVFSQEFQGILLGTHDAGIFKKLVQSNDWIPINNGLPRLNGGYPEVVGIFPVNEMEFYCILKNYGIYHTNNGGYLWESRNYGLPLTFIKSDNDKNNYLVSKITSFSIHPKNPEILLITTKFQIFYSSDGGKHWHELDLFNRKSNFFVTSAFVPIEDLNILIGTAYNGLFSYDLHENVKLIKNDLPKEPYDKWQSIFFHEEIQSILISSKDNNKIYVGTGFGNGLWYSGNAGKNWKKLPFTTDEKFFNIFSIQEFDSENILVESDDEYYLLAIDDFNTKPFQIKEYFEKLPKTLKPVLAVEFSSSKGKIEYRNKHRVRVTSKYYERAKDKNGIYLNAYKANIEYFKKNIDNIKKNNINSVIIEFKDDFGRVMYDSNLKQVKEVGAKYSVIKSKELIEYLNKNDIYIIARIIVFKDKQLYEYSEHKFAIWDSKTNKPWKGIKREYWVDPYSDFVQEYNLSIAMELQKLGVDEIQFDYIRFPTDGPIGNCHYRYRTYDMNPVDAVATFLYKARSRLSIPISIDVYGFNSWYRMGKIMGQDIETLAEFVDVISPMLYPSHFGDYFLKKYYPDEHKRAERIIYLGCKRCSIISDNQVIIRPYLQAFNYKSPGYGKRYIDVQIKGAFESGASGFSLWNPGGDYNVFYGKNSKPASDPSEEN